MKVTVIDLGGKEFDVDVVEGEQVLAVKGKIKAQQGYEAVPEELRLILDGQVLDNLAVFSDTSAKDGDILTLAIVPWFGIMELYLGKINDNTQWHRRHKFALRSKPLQDEVEKIEITIGHFDDQGWGGCQARLFIYLHDPEKEDQQVAGMKLFGPLRTSEYDEAKYGRSPSRTIGKEEAVVALAKPGMVYKLRYQNGGGGGHSITIQDWCCKIFPVGRNTDEVTTRVSGTISLQNSSRLGPDEATGKWEIDEPPYPAPEESLSPLVGRCKREIDELPSPASAGKRRRTEAGTNQ